MEGFPTDPGDLVQEWFRLYQKLELPVGLWIKVHVERVPLQSSEEIQKWMFDSIPDRCRFITCCYLAAELADRFRFDPEPLLDIYFREGEIELPGYGLIVNKSCELMESAYRIMTRVLFRVREQRESLEWVQMSIADMKRMFGVEDQRTLYKKYGWRIRKEGGSAAKNVLVLRDILPTGRSQKPLIESSAARK